MGLRLIACRCKGGFVPMVRKEIGLGWELLAVVGYELCRRRWTGAIYGRGIWGGEEGFYV